MTASLPPHLDSLVGDLRSPDPAVRDGGAYSTLARLQEEGELDHSLAALGDRGLALLDDREVQARTFGALLIALVVDRDSIADRVGESAVRRWLAGIEGWYLTEPDTRGWDDRLGWLHAVAHGADAIGALAGSPHLGRNELGVLLHLLVQRATIPTSVHWLQNEDDRVAVAAMAVLRRDLLDAAAVGAEIKALGATWRSMPLGPLTAAADNSLRLARTLHLQLTLGVRPSPGAAVAHPKVREEVLRMLGSELASLHWFYGAPEAASLPSGGDVAASGHRAEP